MISVCMAAYNGERFIKQQIDSILCQLNSEDELIISDDGSTDKTLEIINSIQDNRIKVFNHEKENSHKDEYSSFRYATFNFENAIKNAKGDYIFLTDQDDLWLKDKVKKCLELFKTYDCVVHNYQVIDENGNVIKNQFWNKNPLHKSLFMNVLDNHFRGCCMEFKTSFLKEILPFDKDIIGHDYWIGSLLSYFGKVYYEMEPLMQYRSYTGTVSAYKKTSLAYKLHHRYYLYKSVLKRIKQIKNQGKNENE